MSKFLATLPSEPPTPLSESKRLNGASFPPDASTFRRCQCHPMPPIQYFFRPSFTHVMAKNVHGCKTITLSAHFSSDFVPFFISLSILTITQYSLPLGSRLRHSIAAYSYWNFQFQQPESAYIQVLTSSYLGN